MVKVEMSNKEIQDLFEDWGFYKDGYNGGHVVLRRMEETGLLERVSAGVVLTGGGASLDGIADLAAATFPGPVRVGLPGAGSNVPFEAADVVARTLGMLAVVGIVWGFVWVGILGIHRVDPARYTPRELLGLFATVFAPAWGQIVDRSVRVGGPCQDWKTLDEPTKTLVLALRFGLRRLTLRGAGSLRRHGLRVDGGRGQSARLEAD